MKNCTFCGNPFNDGGVKVCDECLEAGAIDEEDDDIEAVIFKLLAEHGMVVETFAEAGLLTTDKGVVATLGNGSEYQVTITRSR